MTTRQSAQQGGTVWRGLALNLSGDSEADDDYEYDDDEDKDEDGNDDEDDGDDDGVDVEKDCFTRRSEDVARDRGCTHTYAIVTGKFRRNNDGFDDDGDGDEYHSWTRLSHKILLHFGCCFTFYNLPPLEWIFQWLMFSLHFLVGGGANMLW